jgi:hypothetical protein
MAKARNADVRFSDYNFKIIISDATIPAYNNHESTYKSFNNYFYYYVIYTN